MRLLSDAELACVLPAETHAFAGPIPTQIVSSDEYFPSAQTAAQREVEARLMVVGDALAKKQAMSRRKFFATAAGMAAAFVAMNEVYGPYFEVAPAEASDRDLAHARAQALSGQFIMDTHTHFLRDDTRLAAFVRQREAVGQRGWNPQLAGKPQTLDDLKFDNYVKEIYLDSDTKVALISGAPSDVPQDWFLTNEMAAEARNRLNARFGSRRSMAHAIFTPGQPGWLERVDREIAELKPDAFKGYTIGDNTHKATSKYPWRLDDETLVYPFYERLVKAGLVNVCIHKGLFAPSVEQQFPHLLPYADVRDLGRAARDWPQLNFVIYHSAYRLHPGNSAERALALFDQSGRIAWVTDLAEIPSKFGVSNVYGDVGQLFAHTAVAQPRLNAALMGTLIRGLGHDHVLWGTDALWTGSPHWQIEALRRLEIPEPMQKQHGFAPLGPATGAVKTAIFGDNVATLYRFDRRAELHDRAHLTALKRSYESSGGERSNLRYGYVIR